MAVRNRRKTTRYSSIEGLEQRALLTLGALDPSFGGGGFAIEQHGFGANSVAEDSAIQSDGKVVAVGTSQTFDQGLLQVARFNTDGSLDASFGDNGRVVLESEQQTAAKAVAIRPDGRILVAGEWFQSGLDYVMLVQFNSDGSLDTSFGDDGISVGDFDDQGNAGEVGDLHILPDGKVLVTGAIGNPDRFGLSRYNSDGSLDESFATDGRATNDIGASQGGESIFVQDDGRILVSGRGTTTDTDDSNFITLRYLANGQIDSSFGGGDGIVETDFDGAGTRSHTAEHVEQFADGRILVVGRTFDDGGELAIARYNANGTPDTSFGTNGQIVSDLPESTVFNDAVLDGDSIVVVGRREDGPTIGRFNSNGSLDTTFGDDGFTELTNDPEEGGFVSLVQQADGSFVGLISNAFEDEGPRNFANVRFNSDGELDEDYEITSAVRPNLLQGHSVLLQADGGIVIGGNYEDEGIVLRRRLTGGTPDSSFGENGTVVIPRQIGTYSTTGDQVSLAQQSDGRLIVGVDSRANSEGFLLRLNTDGSIDETFGLRDDGTGLPGVARTILPSGGADFVTVLDNDQILVSGRDFQEIAVQRFAVDGSDERRSPSYFENESAAETLEADDGGYFVVGNDTDDIVIVRVDAQGQRDQAFGAAGFARADLNGSLEFVRDAILTSDDKLVVLASAANGDTGRDLFIARFNLDDGSLDDTFGTGGFTAIDLGAPGESPRNDDLPGAIAELPDGRFVVGANAWNGFTEPALTIAVLTSDGELDTTVDDDGIVGHEWFEITNDRNNLLTTRDIAVQPDGRVVVAGVAVGPEREERLAVARLLGADDEVQPTVSILDSDAINEGDDITITVELSEASSERVTVIYSTADGTGSDGAVAPGDYTSASGQTLTFEPGQTSQTITIETIDDDDQENAETFLVNLDSTTGAIIGDGQTEVIVNDNDEDDDGGEDDPPVVSISDSTLVEGDSGQRFIEFTVTRSHNNGTPSIPWSTANDTATAGEDYIASSGTVTFEDGGSLTQTIQVPILGDEIVERDEMFFVNLGTANCVDVDDGQGVGTIENDDSATISINSVSRVEGDSGSAAFVFEISIDAEVDEAVTFTAATADGSAVAASGDYESHDADISLRTPGTNETLSVFVIGDTDVENDETFFVDLSGLNTNGRDVTFADNRGSGTILNDDDDDGGDPPTDGPCDSHSESGVFLVDGTLFVIGTDGNDILRTSEGRINTRVWLNGSRTRLRSNDVTDVVMCGFDGRDILRRTGGQTTKPAVLEGGNGRDALFGGIGPDTLRGGGGNDNLRGARGHDELDGGNGNDRLRGQRGDDIIDGGAGNDTIFGGTGNDILLGADGRDRVLGNAGLDLVIGGADRDTVDGGTGADILIAGSTSHSSDDLFGILAEWTNTERDLQQRLDNVRGDNPSADRENGNAFLNPTTISDETESENLFGRGGTDWFFATESDRLKDLKGFEELDLL